MAKQWPVARIEELGLLVDAGFSANQAARRLAVSRNAAIGEARRRGWRFGKVRDPATLSISIRSKRLKSPPLNHHPEVQGHNMHCRFDPDTYETVKQLAKRDGVTMAQMIRDLVEWGLEAEEAMS